MGGAAGIYRSPYEEDEAARRGTDQPTVTTPGTAGPRIDLMPDVSSQVADIYKGVGGSFGADEQNDLANRLRNGQTVEQIIANTRQQAEERFNQSTNHRIYDSQSAEGNALYGSGSGNGTNTPGGSFTGGSGGGVGTPAFRNTSPQFTDSSQRLLEDYALDRFGQLQNPNPNSGQALYEKYARELIDTLRGPVYSAGDESVIKGTAFDNIERERTATKQRWLEELSRRGIPPSSGIALNGFQHIDDQFGAARTSVEAQFARDAIDRTRLQREQVVSTAGQLAGTEEGRLDKAATYANIPYALSQDAFNRNLQLVGAGGSPASQVQSALSVLSSQQAQSMYSAQQRQAMTDALLKVIGYTFD